MTVNSDSPSIAQTIQTRKTLAEAITIVVCLIVALIAMPNLLSDFRLNLLGRWCSYAIVALAIDLIWGYTGMLSLGHGVFFALGGYCLGMHLKLRAPTLTGASNPSGETLPDFMAYGGLDRLPFWWKPFDSPGFAMAAVVVVPAIFAAILGYMLFRNRIKGVYFAIISQAVSVVVGILLVGYLRYTGGTNGLSNFKTFLGANLNTQETRLTIYLATVLILLGIYLFSRWLTSGQFGRLLVAIRDDEFRARYAGYHVATYKLVVFVISAIIAAIGGAMFLLNASSVNPNQAGIVQSVDFVVWVTLGGRGCLVGAVIGALLVNGVQTALSEQFPEFWLLLQGLILILVVVFFPKGLTGIIGDLLNKAFFSGVQPPPTARAAAD